MQLVRSRRILVADTRSAVAHLVRRAAFGAPASRIDELADLGYEGAVEAVCDLTAPDPSADAVASPAFDTAGYLASRKGDAAAKQAAEEVAASERRALPLWWVRRMVAADNPAREKLTFLWHDHFATSMEKVKIAEVMHHQRATLYELGAGRFDRLVHAIARDPAMLIWLDGRESTAGSPNENFARELLELFTLGHRAGPGGHDDHDDQPYTEADVREAARALTGWVIDPAAFAGSLVPGRHDPGTKTLLGTTGRLGLDEVVTITTQHPACAPHVVAHLWSRLARPATAADPVVRELAADFARDLDIAALLRRIFLHPAFLEPETRAGLVKTPVDYLVGIARTLGIDPDESVLPVLAGLGQVPFLPPDVDGWPANEAWLSTASALLRLRVATYVAQTVRVDELVGARPSERPGILSRTLGVDGWGAATSAALRAAPDAGAALTIALVAPEHLVA